MMMAPSNDGNSCRTCLKTFSATDLSVKLSSCDESNNVTVGDKLQACVPELDGVNPDEVLCTKCNYMLGICYNFRKTCLEANNRCDANHTSASSTGPNSIHSRISNKGTPSLSLKDVGKSKKANERSFAGALAVSPDPKAPQNSAKTPSQNHLKTGRASVSESAPSDPTTSKATSRRVTRQGENTQKSNSQRTTRLSAKCNPVPDEPLPELPAFRKLSVKRPRLGNSPVKPSKTDRPTKTAARIDDDEDDGPPVLDHYDSMSTSSCAVSEDAREPELSRNSPLLEILSEDTMDFEERSQATVLARNRSVVEQIIKCNSHLSGYSAEMLECAVEIEPLPNTWSKKGKKLEYLCQCNHCGITFTSKIKLLTHIRRHFKYKPHECTICKRRYYEANDLKVHMIAHEKNDKKTSAAKEPTAAPNIKKELGAPAVDGVVPVTPEASTSLAFPQIKVEPLDEPVTMNGNSMPTLPKEPVVAEKTVSVAKKRSCERPKRTYIDMPVRQYVRDLECKFCVLKFKSDKETDDHRSRHCTICFKMFEDVAKHKLEHRIKESKGRTDYFCLDCESYKRRPHFYDHISLKAPRCDRCSLMIVSEDKLARHRLLCRDYECRYCGRKFNNYNRGRTHEYHAHERERTGGKSFNCAGCNTEFRTESLLKAHREKCRNGDGGDTSGSDDSRMYRCEICQEHFTHSELIKHMKVHIE